MSKNWCSFPFWSRKFKRGSVMAAIVPSRMEVSYYYFFRIYLSPPNFVKRELPFPHGLKSRTHIGYLAVDHAVTVMCADRAEWSRQIRRYSRHLLWHERRTQTSHVWRHGFLCRIHHPTVRYQIAALPRRTSCAISASVIDVHQWVQSRILDKLYTMVNYQIVMLLALRFTML